MEEKGREIKDKRGRGGGRPKQSPGERRYNGVREREQKENNEKMEGKRTMSAGAFWCKTGRRKAGRTVRYEKGG